MLASLKHIAHRTRATLKLAGRKFVRIDGPELASAFAFDALFSLFPLILLLVTITSPFFDAATVVNSLLEYIGRYMPTSAEMHTRVVNLFAKIVRARGQAGLVAFLILVWPAIRFITTLTHAANRAWGIEWERWWQRPLKGLALMGIMVLALLIGVGLPVAVKTADKFFHLPVFPIPGHGLWGVVVPWLAIFFGLSLFYRLAPRRKTRFSEVWGAALCGTILLHAAQSLFVLYLRHSAALNAIYGAFGGVIALMFWIYLSGAIFIFCACLCSAQAETRPKS